MRFIVPLGVPFKKRFRGYNAGMDDDPTQRGCVICGFPASYYATRDALHLDEAVEVVTDATGKPLRGWYCSEHLPPLKTAREDASRISRGDLLDVWLNRPSDAPPGLPRIRSNANG
jgi:hypothetical protein